MNTSENMTYLQKTSLLGEISSVLSLASHDQELKLICYEVVQSVDKNCRKFAIEALKEFTTLEKSEIDKIAKRAIKKEIPIDLWVDRTIADLEDALLLPEPTFSFSRVNLNKVACRKKKVESAFVMFVRLVASECPQAAKILCKKVMQTPDLDFLYSGCLYIIERCNEFIANSESINLAALNMSFLHYAFDMKGILCYRVETEFLNGLCKKKKNVKRVRKLRGDSNSHSFAVPIPKEIQDKGDKEVSKFIGEKIQEAFSQLISEPKKTYIVKKSFKGIENQDVTIKECETKKEAVNVVKNLEKKFPELKETCTFYIIEKDRENNEEKKLRNM